MSRSLKQKKRGPTPNKNAERSVGAGRETGSLDKYNGRSDLGSRGTKGKEPGGRFSPAYYETPGKIIGQNVNDQN
jgi:hypothetical protein